MVLPGRTAAKGTSLGMVQCADDGLLEVSINTVRRSGYEEQMQSDADQIDLGVRWAGGRGGKTGRK